jgi:hypothetical protein
MCLKEIGLEDAIKRAVPPQQLRSAFRPDPGGARQFVGRVTAERDKVRYLLWIDAISLPDLFGPYALPSSLIKRRYGFRHRTSRAPGG